MVRPKVTKITVEIEGKEPVIIDTTTTELPEAIFFRDTGVYNILTPFYKNITSKMEKDEVKANWGKNIADKIFGAETSGGTFKTIDASFIEDAWTTPTEADGEELISMLTKMPDCPLR